MHCCSPWEGCQSEPLRWAAWRLDILQPAVWHLAFTHSAASRVAAGGAARGVIAIGDQVRGTVAFPLKNGVSSVEIRQAILDKFPGTWKWLVRLYGTLGR